MCRGAVGQLPSSERTRSDALSSVNLPVDFLLQNDRTYYLNT